MSEDAKKDTVSRRGFLGMGSRRRWRLQACYRRLMPEARTSTLTRRKTIEVPALRDRVIRRWMGKIRTHSYLRPPTLAARRRSNILLD